MNERGSPTTGSESPYPGVDEACDWAKLSYSWTLQRLDAVDSRIQNLQAFSASVALAGFAVSGALDGDVDFKSAWLLMALAGFAVIVVAGAAVRAWGNVTLPSPRVLYEQWLAKPEWDFKKDAVYFAGEHFEANRRLINRKGWTADALTIVLALQTVALSVWIAQAL